MSSSADEDCKKILRHASSIIKHFVQEVYGIDTKIKMVKNVLPKEDIKKEVEDSKQKEKTPEDIGNAGSCVAQHIAKDKEEIDANEILNNPFIKKATELFEPKKIEIHPKI